MARALLGAATVLALLAGCLGERAGNDPDDLLAETDQPLVVEYDARCTAALLFQFIDYAQTDQYLPPGFHPRDPQDFLTFIPVALGQAGVILLFVQCAGEDEPASFAAVGIFVEPPFVAGYETGLFDFYEVERFGSVDPYRPALRLAAWPERDADVALALGEPGDVDRLLTVATAQDADGNLVRFDGSANAEVGVGDGPVRFWHDSPDGLGVLEITTSLTARIGAGTCSARSGTVFAAFLGGTSCATSPVAEPVVAAFPGITIDSSARLLPGVHAE